MSMKKKTPLILAAVVILCGFGYLLVGGIGENLVWNVTPNELLAKGEDAYGHPVRLGGQVAPGTVVWDEDRLGVRFMIRDVDGPDIEVYSKGTPSAMFREGIGVVVEGKLVKDADRTVFHSTNLMVKHSNEYRAPKPGEEAHEKYKTLMKQGSQ